MAMNSVCFLQLKSFGDFVIANAAAERVVEEDRLRVRIAIGVHLTELCDTLAPNVQVVVLNTTEKSVPAFFDLKKAELGAGLRSALGLRRALARASIGPDTIILLDRMAAREKFLLGSRRVAAMPSETANIYAGYDRLLLQSGFRLRPAAPANLGAPKTVGIFPGSRLAEKSLPLSLIEEIVAELDGRGVSHHLFLLDGERPDLEITGLPFEVVPRQFSAMRDAVASCQLVVSADSLPAHLAETLRASVVVFTPRPNEFWMPPGVFQNSRWTLFDDPNRMAKLRAMLGG